MRWKISANTVGGYKTDTKCAHSVHGRPTLKDEERFRNGLVRKPYERSLYERTFMSEPFIEKHVISTELCNVNREKHKLKSYRVCRRLVSSVGRAPDCSAGGRGFEPQTGPILRVLK